MTDTRDSRKTDEWSQWLLHTRHAGDPAFDEQVRGSLNDYADRVLDGAALAPGMTLADVGSGDGLIAFRAIERIGPSLKVVLTDISAPLLRHVEALAHERGAREQCTFVECGAEQLTGVPAASVDVVTTRAVLAYVADKVAALREFHRVLKPGGRLSIAEPVFQDDALAACALRAMVEGAQRDPQDAFRPLLHRWKAAQFPDTPEKLSASPLANFSERTLFEWVRVAGFTHIHLELHIDMEPSPITSWKIFLGSSPHPWAPTLDEILAKQFTAQERRVFEQVMRPLVESGTSLTTIRTVYVKGLKAL